MGTAHDPGFRGEGAEGGDVLPFRAARRSRDRVGRNAGSRHHEAISAARNLTELPPRQGSKPEGSRPDRGSMQASEAGRHESPAPA